MTLEDIVKVKLYNEFHDNNIELFNSDRIEYWSKCIPYVEKNFREAYEKAKEGNHSNEYAKDF